MRTVKNKSYRQGSVWCRGDGQWNVFDLLTYNPVGIAHASTAWRVRLRSPSKEICEYLPVSGDLKSGIPADVLTPVHQITRKHGMKKKNTGQLVPPEGMGERTSSQLSDVIPT